MLGTVQGDCNPLDRLMLGEGGGIVTLLTLLDEVLTPKAFSLLAGIYTPRKVI